MSDRPPPDGAPGRVAVQAFAVAALVLVAQAGILAQISALASLSAGAMFLAACALLPAGLRRAHPHARFGAANAVTLLRAGIASGLAVTLTDASLFARPGPAWGLVSVALASLMLDGVDGWLARREGTASAFGARFDMEVDAAFALMLALGLIATGKAGAWVLLLGALRYLFVAAGLILPWLDRPLPPRQSRRSVCVVQIAALIALHAPPVQPPLSVALAAAATAALVWSFAVDVVWLWRNR